MLSEQQVGIAVFGRNPGYSASEDSVVRVQVHNLRERLAEYFSSEGAAEPFVITIPKGGYSLAFTPRSAAAAEPAPPAAMVQAEVVVQRRPVWVAAIFVCLAFALGGFAHALWPMFARWAGTTPPGAQELTPNPVLASVLTPSGQTSVVIEDTMLVVTSVLRGRPLTLPEYLAAAERAPDFRGIIKDPAALERTDELMQVARYVNLANAMFAIRLLRSYPRLSEKATFRHPREIQMRDIRTTNCILFGGQRSNPWIDLYEDSLNFHLRPFTAGRGFENRHPRPEEKALYGDPRSGDKLTYARIALLPNFEAGTHVLIITGMGGAETDAAAQFLLAPDFVDQLPTGLRAKMGNVPPHLEILLSASRVGATVGRIQVVAWRAGTAE